SAAPPHSTPESESRTTSAAGRCSFSTLRRASGSNCGRAPLRLQAVRLSVRSRACYGAPVCRYPTDPYVAVAAPRRPVLSRPAEFPNFCPSRSEEHTSELQSLAYLVCRLLLEKKKYME